MGLRSHLGRSGTSSVPLRRPPAALRRSPPGSSAPWAGRTRSTAARGRRGPRSAGAPAWTRPPRAARPCPCAAAATVVSPHALPAARESSPNLLCDRAQLLGDAKLERIGVRRARLRRSLLNELSLRGTVSETRAHRAMRGQRQAAPSAIAATARSRHAIACNPRCNGRIHLHRAIAQMQRAARRARAGSGRAAPPTPSRRPPFSVWSNRRNAASVHQNKRRTCARPALQNGDFRAGPWARCARGASPLTPRARPAAFRRGPRPRARASAGGGAVQGGPVRRAGASALRTAGGRAGRVW
jgi:hypothetical protein